jgi:hypothetical protein
VPGDGIKLNFNKNITKQVGNKLQHSRLYVWDVPDLNLSWTNGYHH